MARLSHAGGEPGRPEPASAAPRRDAILRGMSSRAAPPLAPASPVRIAVALVALYIVWGSTYLAIRVAVETIPPLTGVGGALPDRGVAPVRGSRSGAATRPATARAASSGATRRSSAASSSPAATGSSRSASRPCRPGIAALIIATLPLWVAILGRVFFGVVLTRTIVAGTVIGFVGVAVLVWPSGGIRRPRPVRRRRLPPLARLLGHRIALQPDRPRPAAPAGRHGHADAGRAARSSSSWP